ncbi:hypothetical protein BD414DRAFT_477554 [Trametes punicea]|nr:hypothetical protein BD414DRAFT_477554 [Trametes punicea]
MPMMECALMVTIVHLFRGFGAPSMKCRTIRRRSSMLSLAELQAAVSHPNSESSLQIRRAFRSQYETAIGSLNVSERWSGRRLP